MRFVKICHAGIFISKYLIHLILCADDDVGIMYCQLATLERYIGKMFMSDFYVILTKKIGTIVN
jgi:hypothetical protein